MLWDGKKFAIDSLPASASGGWFAVESICLGDKIYETDKRVYSRCEI